MDYGPGNSGFIWSDISWFLVRARGQIQVQNSLEIQLRANFQIWTPHKHESQGHSTLYLVLGIYSCLFKGKESAPLW